MHIFQRFFSGKVKLVMILAAGVEAGSAARTKVAAVQIFLNREFIPAGSAKNGVNMPLRARPNANGMAGENFMTILAGVVDAAAGHLDGNDVELRAPVDATRLCVHL